VSGSPVAGLYPRTVTVLGVEDLSPSVTSLHLGPGRGPALDWLPGQHVVLAPLDHPARGQPYSIASAPDPDRPGQLDLALSREGNRELFECLSPGAELWLSDASGSFVFEPASDPTLLVGIGTAVSPLRAMLQAALRHDPGARLVLLFGARSEEELLWNDELGRLAREHSGVGYEPTLSRPGPGWIGRRGRVLEHLEAVAGSLGRPRAFVCGNRSMVRGCREGLARVGVGAERVRSEAY
jgi:ferredoxin-NADP reductase